MLLKGNMTPLVLLLVQTHLHKLLLYKIPKISIVKEFNPFFPLPSITFSTNWLISRSMLLFWTWLSSLNKKNHLKNYMEGKDSTIANLFEEAKEEDSNVNKIGVNNFRHLVKNPPIFISVTIMDKIAHCCLIDNGSGPSVMSKIIMEEIGLSFTNENSRIILSYNNLQHSTIGEIKDVTLVLFTHPEIRTSLKIQVINMLVSNYSIILGRDWQNLIGGYLSLDETHLSVSWNGKNIIVLRKGRISLHIESIPYPNVNYVEEDLGVYFIFADEGDTALKQIDLQDVTTLLAKDIYPVNR
jgi:hypothetical protein